MASKNKSSADDTDTAPARRQTVTIHDVARAAGVSSMTASRVVNRSTPVGEKLRKRVLKAIEELGYVPNLAARAARSGATRLGVLISNPNSSNVGTFLMGIFGESGKNGCQILIEPASAHPSEIDAVRKLIAGQIDGIVIPPPICDSVAVFEVLRRANVPALSFATAEPKPYASAVLIDNFEGARTMTRHLIDLGHQRIAFVRGDPAHSPTLYREEGFRIAMAEAGIEVRQQWVYPGDFSYRSGLSAGQALLEGKQRPTAIFASNDDMAAGVIAMAHGMGIRIPSELSVAGFDDTPIASTIWPELTTIHQPLAQMAAFAVAEMTDMVRRRRAGDDTTVTHRRVDFKLVERGSTGPA